MLEPKPTRTEGALFTGRVKLWEATKGYGFVSKVSDGGDDIFVHYTNVIVDSGRFPAIAPETEVRLSFHLRQGRDTGIKVTDPNGNPLPGFLDKAEAIRTISGEPLEPSAERKTGSVKWFNNDKGFGFIQPDVAGGVGGEDLFVHMKEVEGNLTTLVEGERVEYNIGVVNGRYRAIHVTTEAAKEAQSTQAAQALASTTYAQQPSLVYNPELGTYQYQYGGAGGLVYMDPSAYGLSQANSLAYMAQYGTQGLQPGQTFYSNGQLYMMQPAQPSLSQTVQAQPGNTSQSTQSQLQVPSLTQQFKQQPAQNLLLSQQSQGQLYQSPTTQLQSNDQSSNLQGTTPDLTASQNILSQQYLQNSQNPLMQLPYSTVPSQLTSKVNQYNPTQQFNYSQGQSVLQKRTAPNSENTLEQPRKIVRH